MLVTLQTDLREASVEQLLERLPRLSGHPARLEQAAFELCFPLVDTGV